jgi:hypothetical protein
MTIAYGSNPVEAIYAVVNYNDAGIDSGVAIGTMPEGAKILMTHVNIQTVFNAATTNNLTIGVSALGSELAANTDSVAGVAGLKSIVRGHTQNPLGADRTIYARYAQTGAAATTGKAYIVILYTRV